MIPAVLSDVLNALKHESELVRKKAIGALHRFHQLDKHLVLDHLDKIRRILCDRDPSVMGASLPLFLDMVQDDPYTFKDLVPSFVSILKQIIDHRLPRDYDYHRIPSPWIQMNLLKILAVLGRGDQHSSEGMYEVLSECMKRADAGINVGYAIVYEVISTVTTIYPNTILLDSAASSISRFIRSDSHNLRYIGIKALASIVKDYPKYAADHQLAVIDCLEDPDETLKRKTLDLLYRMTNAVNVEFIVDKLLHFLSNSVDEYFKSALVEQISQCAERFAPSNTWYVQTISKVFELAGDKVKPAVVQTLIQLIAEGSEEEKEGDEDEEDELRVEAVDNFLVLLDKPKLSPLLLQTIAWVLGEYGYLSKTHSKEDIMIKLGKFCKHSLAPVVKSTIISALAKLISQSGTCPSQIYQIIQSYSQSKDLLLQNNCIEILGMLKFSDVMVEVLPIDASLEDIEMNENSFAFLDSFVQQALANGASPYNPPAEFLDNTDESDKKKTLITTPYEMPKLPPATSGLGVLPGAPVAPTGPTPLGPAINNMTPQLNANQGNNLINTRGVAQVWGKKAPEPVSPAPAPSVTSTSTSAPTTPSLNTTGVASVWGNTTPSSSSTPAAPTAPVAPTPTEQGPVAPRELTEKEKMAAALFGGVAKSTTTTSKRKSTTSSSATTTAPSASSPPPVPSASMDLFSGMSTVTAPPAAPAAPSSTMDLFSGMNTTPAPSTPAPVNLFDTTPIQPTSNSLLDDFSGLSMSSPVPAPAPVSSMTPLVINTAEYGKRWGSCPVDLRSSISFPDISLDKLCYAMPSQFHHVESILATNEAIFSSIENSTGSVVLVHAKVHKERGVVDILVKSINQTLCQRESNEISQALALAQR